MTNTPGHGFLLGGLNFLLAVVAWLRVAVTEDVRLPVLLAIGWSLLATAFLASSSALQRRAR